MVLRQWWEASGMFKPVPYKKGARPPILLCGPYAMSGIGLGYRRSYNTLRVCCAMVLR